LLTKLYEVFVCARAAAILYVNKHEAKSYSYKIVLITDSFNIFAIKFCCLCEAAKQS